MAQQRQWLWDFTSLPLEPVDLIGEYLPDCIRTRVTVMKYDIWDGKYTVRNGTIYDEARVQYGNKMWNVPMDCGANNGTVIHGRNQVWFIDTSKDEPCLSTRNALPTDRVIHHDDGTIVLAEIEWKQKTNGQAISCENGHWKLDITVHDNRVVLELLHDGSLAGTHIMPNGFGKFREMKLVDARGDLVFLNIRYYDIDSASSDEKMYMIKLLPMHDQDYADDKLVEKKPRVCPRLPANAGVLYTESIGRGWDRWFDVEDF